jgi:HK97 family phage prohead protease
MTIERRTALELRTEGRKLVGYAATFGARAQIADFTETIAKGAFAGSLANERDVLGLVDHDPGKLLARTASGTLRLAEDDKGLRFELDVPDTQLGRDILALAERRDIGGASFGFRVPKGGDKWEGRNRTLTRVDLFDVSVVQSFPAYPQTSVSARHRAGKFMPLDVAKRYLELIV